MIKSKKRKNVFGLSSTHMLVLSLLLLFIIIEALFIVRGQAETIQASKGGPNVAGVSTDK